MFFTSLLRKYPHAVNGLLAKKVEKELGALNPYSIFRPISAKWSLRRKTEIVLPNHSPFHPILPLAIIPVGSPRIQELGPILGAFSSPPQAQKNFKNLM
jgi:hypothetical protein